MTKCPISNLRLASALAIAMGLACAGPGPSTAPDGGTPALSSGPPRPLECLVSAPRHGRCGVATSRLGQLPFATTHLSGYALHNRTATDSTAGQPQNPGQ